MPFSSCAAVTSTSVSAKSGKPSERMQALTTTTGRLLLQFDIAISFKRGGNKTERGTTQLRVELLGIGKALWQPHTTVHRPGKLVIAAVPHQAAQSRLP